MATEQQLEALDAVNGAVLEATADAGLGEVREALGVLKAALDEAHRARVQGWLDALESDPVAGLASLTEELTAFEDSLRNPQGTFKEPRPGGVLELPPEIDEDLFAAFLSEQKLFLDEFADLLDALQEGDASVLRDLRGRIHTVKGESGVVGLGELERLCHAVEDYLERKPPIWDQAKRLGFLRSWMEDAFEAYSRYRHPMVPAARLIELLHVRPSRVPEDLEDALAGDDMEAPSTGAAPASGAMPPLPTESTLPNSSAAIPSPPSLPDGTSEPSLREDAAGTSGGGADAGLASDDGEPDATDLELLGEFLDESEDGVAKVDELLLDIEANGANHEKVNGLFRVFHTIKGVSAFLDLKAITQLAHATETMLDRVRTGELEAGGLVLDLVFDATSLMRAMLKGLRHNLRGEPISHDMAEVEPIIEKMLGVTTADGEDTGVSPAEPGEKLGEILKRQGLVDDAGIEQALGHQKETGQPLGEVLIRHSQLPPKAVAQALRSQKQAKVARSAKLKELVKVDLERVDRLVETIGELVIVESMVAHAPEIIGLPGHVRTYLGQLAKITRELQEIGMRMRTVPVRGEFQKLSRMVRDLGRKSGKTVRVQISGEGTEMDRNMVEQISDPLLHLIRNAVDHGVEGPDARRAAGKSPTGRIELSAFHEGDSIVIEVTDDGKGIDRNAVLNKAIARGLVKESDKLSESETFDLIFQPGFSTAAQVTEISGRGVGMDVVKRNIEAVRGRIQVRSEPGKGTTFRLVLPLTLAIIDGMVIRSGEENYILPTLSILESLQPTPAMLKTMTGSREFIRVRGEILPMLRMSRLLGVDGAGEDPLKALVVIVETMRGKVGVLVDEVITQQQVVIKHMGSGFEDLNLFSGAAILSDGRVGLILNVNELVAVGEFQQRHGERTHGGASAVQLPTGTA